MADKEAHYDQTAPATLHIEAKIEEADPAINETTCFTVSVQNTGTIAVQPITVGCALTGTSDTGVTLFGPPPATPVSITTPTSPLGPGESRSRHWVTFNDGTGAGDHPPFTIQITVIDPNNPAPGVVHNFTCP